MKLATNGSTERDRWTLDVPFPSSWTLKEVLNEVTKQMCMQALQRSGGNKQESARLLGTSRDALYSYIRRFGIEVDLLT
jgi:DNA-binding NtrC family response regulator